MCRSNNDGQSNQLAHARLYPPFPFPQLFDMDGNRITNPEQIENNEMYVALDREPLRIPKEFMVVDGFV